MQFIPSEINIGGLIRAVAVVRDRSGTGEADGHA
jgi:hypothetical protein